MTSALTFTLGAATVTLYDGYTVIRFRGGASLTARHDDVLDLDQMQTALNLGYSSVEAMNVDHDPVHQLLATWLGHDRSPTLYFRARGLPYPWAYLEENAVKAIQALMCFYGLTAVDLLQRHGTRQLPEDPSHE